MQCNDTLWVSATLRLVQEGSEEGKVNFSATWQAAPVRWYGGGLVTPPQAVRQFCLWKRWKRALSFLMRKTWLKSADTRDAIDLLERDRIVMSCVWEKLSSLCFSEAPVWKGVGEKQLTASWTKLEQMETRILLFGFPEVYLSIRQQQYQLIVIKHKALHTVLTRGDGGIDRGGKGDMV